MITDYVPGAYVTHDQLHIRGGHQISWLVDGVPVPNTNIASNVGPQFDPKDIDYLEVDRGSYGAEFGDRTYGVFNVVPRTGFERNNEAELVLSSGNFYQTNDQLSFGSHTERFAYYASVNGNRSDLGIATPVPQVVHDAANGYGGFGSLIFNVDPSNQLRLVTSLRKDYYQIPYDPYPNDHRERVDPGNGFAPQYPSIGLRDGQHESDALVNFSWVHTFNSKLLLTVSPFYHYNSANYDSSPDDVPIATTDHRTSTYAGGQASFSANFAKNNLQAGLYSFYQQDNELFGAIFNDGSGNPPSRRHASIPPAASTHFSSTTNSSHSPGSRSPPACAPRISPAASRENAISPRFGAALTVPRLNWTFRAFYGHYYQAPPLLTVSGPLLQFCQRQQSAASSRCTASATKNISSASPSPFADGSSTPTTSTPTPTISSTTTTSANPNLFFPITIEQAVIRGWEATLRSPRIAHRAQIHLAYSNQIAEGGGAITGGLTDFSSAPDRLLARSTTTSATRSTSAATSLSPGAATPPPTSITAPASATASPASLIPATICRGHTTFDLSLAKTSASASPLRSTPSTSPTAASNSTTA